VAEACWERLGKAPFACTQTWPTFDDKPVIGDTITVAVQGNGKLRATFEAERGASEDALKAAALALPAVQKHLGDKAPKKVIVARGSLVNVVV
jgi:leucyl-tRNA synthetase